MKPLLCLVVYALFALQSFKANPIIVSHTIPFKWHEGYVIRTTNDTIYGMIVLGQTKGFKKGIRIRQGSRKNFVNNDDIKQIRIFARDSLMIKASYTDYVMINHKPWRVIAKNKIEVFDQVLYTDERPAHINEHLSILENGSMVSSYNWLGLSHKKDMVAFINKRYHAHFNAEDFKSARDIIDYIAANG